MIKLSVRNAHSLIMVVEMCRHLVVKGLIALCIKKAVPTVPRASAVIYT